MSIKIEDINLETFLKRFTFTNEEGKIQIDVGIFLQVASLLKLDFDFQRFIRK